jgi:hypothetical protein
MMLRNLAQAILIALAIVVVGASTAIARELNEREIPAARGGKWHLNTVSRRRGRRGYRMVGQFHRHVGRAHSEHFAAAAPRATGSRRAHRLGAGHHWPPVRLGGLEGFCDQKGKHHQRA